MSLLGLAANLSTSFAVSACMKGTALASKYKIVNKVVIPAGIFFASYAAGDYVQKDIEREIEDTKASIKAMKAMREAAKKTFTPEQLEALQNDIQNGMSKEEAIDKVVNIFDAQMKEDEDDGNS